MAAQKSWSARATSSLLSPQEPGAANCTVDRTFAGAGLGLGHGPVAVVNDIERRKSEHIDIVLSGKVSARHVTTGLECLRFEHCALPEISLGDVDVSVEFLGRRLAAPFIVSSMTGGPRHARRINHAIACAARECGIGFGVGSQRIALEGWASSGFDLELRKLAGPVPILANMGGAQLLSANGCTLAERAIEMIDADALIVHLNPLQEAVQAGGDRDWNGLLQRIEELVRRLSKPVIVKEVGFGISATVARQLVDAGVRIIDVAGAGGTSWAAVEAKRARSAKVRAVAEAFRDWGIPTAQAVRQVRAACPAVTIIASGGIRNGLDAAKAIRLGADLAGQAAISLAPALAGPEALVAHWSGMIEQLRIACFCTGSRDLAALRKAPLVQTLIE